MNNLIRSLVAATLAAFAISSSAHASVTYTGNATFKPPGITPYTYPQKIVVSPNYTAPKTIKITTTGYNNLKNTETFTLGAGKKVTTGVAPHTEQGTYTVKKAGANTVVVMKFKGTMGETFTDDYTITLGKKNASTKVVFKMNGQTTTTTFTGSI